MRNRMEAGSGRWNDRWSGLASIPGAVSYARGRSPGADSRSSVGAAVRLPVSLVSAIGVDFHRGLKPRCSGWRPKRHETLREPMERRQGRWNDRGPDMAAVFIAVPCAPRLRRFFLRWFRPRLGPCARSCPPVRLFIPVVATIGALFLSPRRAPARPRPCRLANLRRSSQRAPVARRTPSCGSTRRRASIIIREPAITGTRSGAHTCARLTRVEAAIARRRTANVRPKLIKILGRQR